MISYSRNDLNKLTSNVPKDIVVFHNRLAQVANNHDHLIGGVVPPPNTLVMGVVGLDEGMVGNACILKVPFILGGCDGVVVPG